jgi:hypothetical protein
MGRGSEEEAKLKRIIPSAKKEDLALEAIALFHEKLFSWERGHEAAGRPEATSVIQDFLAGYSFSEKEIASLALLAEKDWKEKETKRASLIYPRLEEFREHLLPTPDLRRPLKSNHMLIFYPSAIEGGEITLYKSEQSKTTRSALSEDEIALLNEDLVEEGLPPVRIVGQEYEDEETAIYLDPEEPKDPGLAEDFFSIVEDIESTKSHSSWHASLEVPLTKDEDSILISLQRQYKEESLGSIVDLEKRLIAGVISDEPVELKVFAAPEDPEKLKTISLDILAQGKDHPRVRLMKLLGENENKIIKEAEDVVFGERDDQTPWVLSGSFFDKNLGEISIMITAKNEKNLANYVKLVVPKGYWKRDL